jgi:hypothetical protein
MMNRDFVVWNLEEAAEELARTIKEMRASADYSAGEFWVAMQHLYSHLNTAWIARDASAIQITACPWCGRSLPSSLRTEWFAELERRGIADPVIDPIPPEFTDERWYSHRR